MKYTIGIDIGTSGTKTVLFDTAGNVVATANVDYPLSQPHNGWAEQNPDDWWQATVRTLRQVTDCVDAEDILGIGLSGQMHGLVMLDEKNEILRPAILWCDQRTATECAEIEAIVGRERLMEITASPALTGFTASKLMWVKKHEPELYARCRHILLPKDYVRFRLTGEYATDVSDASGMQLLDIKGRCWSDELLSLLEVDRSRLATLYESCEVSGRITEEAAELTGLSCGIPVAAGAGDNASAAIGTGVVSEGDAFVTIGTSGVVFAHTEQPVVDPLGRVHTFCSAVKGKWHVMGVTQAAGLSLKWFRDTFCSSTSYAEMYAMAESVPVGARRLLFLPYLMGERTPHLDPDARGVFFGLSAVHGVPELTRAVLEGVTFSLRDCLTVFGGMALSVDRIAVCGGGGKSPLWQQMIADNFACEVKTLVGDECAALGAALLAGVACGVYASVEEACAACVHERDTIHPEPARYEAYAAQYALYGALYQSLRENFGTLAGR